VAESGSTSSHETLLTPNISNFAFEFDLNLFEDQFKIMVLCLRHSSLAPALSKTVTISHQEVSDMINSVQDIDDKNRRYTFMIGGKEERFYKEDLCRMLKLPIPNKVDNVTPLMILDMFNYMGHDPLLMIILRFRNANIPSVWRFLSTALYRCLTGGTTIVDQGNTTFYKILHHLLYGSQINIGNIL